MSKPDVSSIKYVCIHAHFYQPPRENPWLEAIEQEESAAPCHDWNERINSECYRANAAARQVDGKNRTLNLCNNYSHLSFNFGPTLMAWIKGHDSWLYQAIVESDRESCTRFNGHGNAIAQVYNHLIMPLANRRDKVTQILWGIRDFELHFGRRPEGMWLAETAVDDETLQVLADAGILFTILSPYQAARWRSLDKGASWQDVRGGSIPTGRPYRYTCRNGKSIVLFFYDGGIAKGIAFERLLDHSSKLLNAVHETFEHRSALHKEPWLIHTATDGESYGHHFKFGDMALAAAFNELKKEPSTRLINYGTFLASFPVRAEVEILPNTAWSCAHGLGRWQEDCGCRMNHSAGWNQKWRAPLREAMNMLRDALASHYEREMAPLARDPWKARDEYIDVLSGPEGNRATFIQKHLRAGLGRDAVCRFFQLLEMQRCAMLMFISCGWFFDEISSLESVLILRYAARAIQLAQQTGAPPVEDAFLKILEKAPSNVPEYGNGAVVYRKKVKPQVVEEDRVAANYAIHSLVRSPHHPQQIYCYDIDPAYEEDLGTNPAPCLLGRVTVRDRRTQLEKAFCYAAIHFRGLDFRCSVKPDGDGGEYERILEELERCVEEQDTVQMVRVLDRSFGTSYFTLHDVFHDLRSSIALDISQDKLSLYTDFQRHLYQIYRPLIMSLRQWEVEIPGDLRGAIRRVLSDDVSQVVESLLAHQQAVEPEGRTWCETDFFCRANLARLRSILSDARSWGVALNIPQTTAALGEALVRALTTLKDRMDGRSAAALHRLISICRILGVKPQFWKLQTTYFSLVRKAVDQPSVRADIQDFEGFLKELDCYLECRFARFITGSDE